MVVFGLARLGLTWVWCLVSAVFGVWCQTPKGACAVGVWCLVTVAEGRVRCRCLVSGVWGSFTPYETPFLGGVVTCQIWLCCALRGRR